MIRKQTKMTVEAAAGRLKALCAASEQCSGDLRRKMARWGLTERQASMVIEELERERFVDDFRFAKAYAHDKLLFSGWGRYKISQGLWAKGVGRDEIDEAIEALDPDDYRRKAYDIIKTRARDMQPDRESKMKLLRFGAGRGFETSLLVKIINSPALWEVQSPD